MIRFLLFAAITIITLTLPFTANSQSKTKKNEAISNPITTKTAVTQEGRKVLLKSDGTWMYADKYTAVPNVSATEKSTLTFQTGIVFNSGEIKPVARTTFYLLDNSFATIVMNAGYSYPSSEKVPDKNGVYLSILLGYGDNTRTSSDTLNFALSAIKPHVIQTVTTDFDGKATFEKLPPGKYWLMGVSGIKKYKFIWDLEIDLLSGGNTLILDQNNVAYDL